MHRLTATDTPMVRYTRTIFPSYANEETTDTDMEYLKNNFDPFKYVPTFYYIKKNKVIDYLVISDWNNPIKELDNWIQNVE